MGDMGSDKQASRKKERTVRCPVEGCEAEKLARGIHLHVMQSSGNGHGPKGEVPDGLAFDELETVGKQEVGASQPQQGATERELRQCPYCDEPFKGRRGLGAHFSQLAGRKGHPDGMEEFPAPADCPVVRLDQNDNIIEIMNDNDPETVEDTATEADAMKAAIHQYIADLWSEGRREEAAHAERRLLDSSRKETSD